MRFIYSQAGYDYVQLEDTKEIDFLNLSNLGFFRGYGITDYSSFLKMWLRRFPKPVIIIALKKRIVVGFVYIEEWGEGIARDGQPIYTLRSIEVSDKFRRNGIGRMMALLAMFLTPGHIIVKPINKGAAFFFKSLKFKSPSMFVNPPVEMSRHQDHLLLTAWDKKKLINENNVNDMLLSQLSTIKLRTDNITLDRADVLLDRIEAMSNMLKQEISTQARNESDETRNTVGQLPENKSDEKPVAKAPERKGYKLSLSSSATFARKSVTGRKVMETNVKHVEGPSRDAIINEKPSGVSIGLIYSSKHKLHFHREKASIESPNRIERVYKMILSRKICDTGNCDMIADVKPAGKSDLELVHTGEYIDKIMKYCKMGGGLIGPDMFFTRDSFKAASYAVGGAMLAADIVNEGRYDYSVALIRPPGHHATSDQYGGFCIFNNSAVAARHIQEMGQKKVAIVDWDAHAANGTMEIFYDDPSVLLISMHQDPATIYPHVGYYNETGSGAGEGYTLNIPMPVGSGDREYRKAMDNLVLPALKKFSPDFVLGVNGFDAFWGDPYTKLFLTSDGYYFITNRLARLYKGKLSVIIEGGYNRSNGQLFITLLNALKGDPNNFNEDNANIIRPSETERYDIAHTLDNLINKIKSTHPIFN